MSIMKEGLLMWRDLISHAKNQYMKMIRAKEWHSQCKEIQEILALTTERAVSQWRRGELAQELV
jgi:hypothetical protein